jgi:hypothetical protein
MYKGIYEIRGIIIGLMDCGDRWVFGYPSINKKAIKV